MNKIKILIVEGDEVQIEILENYLCDNNDINIKHITTETYKKYLTKLLRNLG